MNKYIDIHTHVLPGMGCGPETPAESLAMLRALQEHGVKTVIATPFFNPETEPADAFLKRRAEAYARLQQAMGEEPLPHIALGAEVLLCPAVLECGRIDRFRVEQTGYVLTPELDESYQAQAQAALDEMKGYYTQYLLSSGISEDEVDSVVTEELAAAGYTYDTLYESAKLKGVLDHLYALGIEGVEVT